MLINSMTLPRHGRIYLAEKLLKTVILFEFIPKVMSGRNLPMPGSPLWDGAPVPPSPPSPPPPPELPVAGMTSL